MRRLSLFLKTPASALVGLLIMTITLSSCKDKNVSSPTAALQLRVITSSLDGFSVNSTLITGEKDAILIDAQFTVSDADKLAAIIKDTKKNLTTIYISHSHPDHYFGLVELKKAFPDAKIVALASTVADINKTWRDKVATWKPTYGDNVTSNPVIPDVLNSNMLSIEGNDLQIFGNVQGDEANNSYVWVSSLKAVICGDIDYNGVFPWTLETTPAQRVDWKATLDKISALNPSIVVAGHKKPESNDDASSLAFTKQYLTFYDATLPGATSSAYFQSKIKAQYPGLILDVILQTAADAAFTK